MPRNQKCECHHFQYNGMAYITPTKKCPLHLHKPRPGPNESDLRRIAALTDALRLVLDQYPAQDILDDLDDDQRSGKRKWAGNPLSITTLRRLRKLLE